MPRQPAEKLEELHDRNERMRVAQLRALVAESEKDFEEGRFTTVNNLEEHRAHMADILQEAKQKRGLC